MKTDVDFRRACVVGAGTMGRGIAQLLASSGVEVGIYDQHPGAAAGAIDAIRKTLAGLVAKSKMSTKAATETITRLRIKDDLDGGLKECDLAIEAIVEDLNAKRELFSRFEALTSDECVLATNTSSLSVTAISATCARPERIIGLHFFNPAPLMRIVEVVPGLETARDLIPRATAFVRQLGHEAVVTKDTPGFLINHAGRGYGTEALRILGEGIATAVDVDRVMTEGVGFRMGPFELLDLIGLDVTHGVMESLYRQFYEEPRFRPSILLQQLVSGGRLGRKTGAGFHRYREGKQILLADQDVPKVAVPSIWLSDQNATVAASLRTALSAAGWTIDAGARPDPNSIFVVMPFGEDATTAALSEEVDPARTVALDTCLWPVKRVTLMATPVTLPEVRAAATFALSRTDHRVTLISDSPGFIAQRILATIVNIACDIAQQQIASPEDIEGAVPLGLGYPSGPLTLGDKLGPKRVLRILKSMHELYGDPRYRPSPWLWRRAALGVSLSTSEGE